MGSSAGLIVNLDEFSELCGVTSETMRGHVRAIEGNPAWLIKRGDRGRGYEIEAQGGLAWWKAKREADEHAEGERLEALRQLRFEELGDAAEAADALSLSGRQRREEYAAALDRLKLRRTMGELVEVGALEPLLTHAAVELRRQLQLVPGEFAALQGVSPEETSALSDLIERALGRFVDELEKSLSGTGGG